MIYLRTLLAMFVCGIAATADDWPQWRGPKSDGHSAEKGLPTEWGAEKNIVWKLKMPGIGAGTPAIWGDNIFVTSVDGESVVAMGIGTDGKEKWKRKLTDTGAKRYKNPSGADVSDAAASCATDGKHVWAFAGNGTLACFTTDGTPVWTADMTKYGKIEIAFGAHWTPVLYKGKLYLQVMHRKAQKLVCYDALTGKEDWAVERPGAGKGESPDVYASAFIWEGEGGPLLIAHGNDFCTGHRLTDGSEVWRVQDLNPSGSRAWRFVSDPLITPDLIVVPSCKNGPTVAARVGDVLYMCGHGSFTAHDIKTGKEIFKGEITKGYHWAKMVIADGKIYATSQDGVTDVLEAGRVFKKVATNTLPDKLFGSPAVANGRIYFRGYGHLWAIGTK
jgi:outer membrane protein assembly factor BamB